MTRDDAKKAAAWAKAHDDALTAWKDRILRRNVIVEAFDKAKDQPVCQLDINQRAQNSYGDTVWVKLQVPAYIARNLLLTDIAAQITRARIAALKAGVDAALLVDPGPPEKKP